MLEFPRQSDGAAYSVLGMLLGILGLGPDADLRSGADRAALAGRVKKVSRASFPRSSPQTHSRFQHWSI